MTPSSDPKKTAVPEEKQAEQRQPQQQPSGDGPNAVLSEQMVLGILISDDEGWDNLDTPLKKEYFYNPRHQIIFEAVVALIGKRVGTDEVTIIEELELRGDLEDAGGKDYIAELSAGAVMGMEINQYAAQVMDRFLRRRLISEIGKIGRSARSDSETGRSLLDKAEQQIFQLRDQETGLHYSHRISKYLEEALGQIEYRSKHPDELPGISTGFHLLDGLTDGLQAADLVIVAGRPSMGKTSLALSIAAHTSVNVDNPKASIIFSMEMPAVMLTVRLISMLGNVELGKLRSGKVNDNDWNKIRQAADMLEDAPIYIDDSANMTPMEIRSRTRRVIRNLPGSIEPGIIMVDYLQLMYLSQTNENRTTEMSEISRSLKGVAKDFNLPLMALSQLNRGVENRQNRRPVMSDLRESGAIEQDADLILFIYRDEVYNENSEDRGIAEIIVGKQRNGPTGMARLTFNGKYTNFFNLETEKAEYSDI